MKTFGVLLVLSFAVLTSVAHGEDGSGEDSHEGLREILAAVVWAHHQEGSGAEDIRQAVADRVAQMCDNLAEGEHRFRQLFCGVVQHISEYMENNPDATRDDIVVNLKQTIAARILEFKANHPDVTIEDIKEKIKEQVWSHIVEKSEELRQAVAERFAQMCDKLVEGEDRFRHLLCGIVQHIREYVESNPGATRDDIMENLKETIAARVEEFMASHPDVTKDDIKKRIKEEIENRLSE